MLDQKSESNDDDGLSFLRVALILSTRLLCCCSISKVDFNEGAFLLLLDRVGIVNLGPVVDVVGQSIDDCLLGGTGGGCDMMSNFFGSVMREHRGQKGERQKVKVRR